MIFNAFRSIEPSPTENLACLLNVSDFCIGYVHGTHLFPRWSAVEDDKALYILRDMTAKDIEDVRESVKEFMTGNIEENFNEPVPSSEEYISGNVKENFNELVPVSEEYISGNVNENFNELVPVSEEYISGNVNENFNEPVPSSEEYISGNVKENFKQYDPKRSLLPIIDIMRGDEYAPTGEYYYHVMKDAKEVRQFVESLHGSPDTVNGNINASIKMYAVPHQPQAVYILVALGNPQTRNPYGGYAMEIYLDNSLYSVYDLMTDFTDVNRKLFIPKKKVEGTKAIGGNLIFFQEKKFIKPTPWRPT
ncbi:hypothetical protein Tco_0849505 [Tanacetum coccineum]